MIFGVNPDLTHQDLRIASQLGNEIGKEAQNPGVHDVEYLAGIGVPIPQRSLIHSSLPTARASPITIAN